MKLATLKPINSEKHWNQTVVFGIPMCLLNE